MAQREAYRDFVVRKATGQPEPIQASLMPPGAVVESPAADHWLAVIRACEYHNPGCCAHPSPFCSLYEKDVSRDQCIECLTSRGITP